jgi:hypothetical protein
MGAVKDPPRRVVTINGPQAPSRLVEVPVDGVLGQAKLARDLLGAHVAIDQAQALALTLGEAMKALGLIRKDLLALSHRVNLMRALRFGKRRNIKPLL